MNDYNPKEKYKLDQQDPAETSKQKDKPVIEDSRELYKKETTPRAS
jgi:hypothetical protein